MMFIGDAGSCVKVWVGAGVAGARNQDKNNEQEQF